MTNLIGIVPVAVGAFFATNLDNFILLAALLARYRRHAISVVAGYLTCMLILGIAGLAVGEIENYVPIRYLGLLGIVPIFIGVVELVRIRRDKEAPAVATEASIDSSYRVFLTTLISQLGNGVDTILIFGVLFADSTPAADTLIICTIAAMAITFVLGAMYAVRHPTISSVISRYARRFLPFILIIVGVYVLANTATDALPS
jgi:cadmium resistance protein CadD (predicted permease)